MIALPPSALVIEIAVAATAAAAFLWTVPPWVARRSPWAPPTRATFVSLFRGPLLSLVLAGAAIGLYQQLWTANPGAIPPALAPATIAILAELAVVWVVVGTVAAAARRHTISDRTRSGRFLQYGIYAAGLLGVVLVLLTSPDVPHVAGGIWALIGFATGLLVTYLAVHVVNLVVDRYLSALAHRDPALETLYRFLRRVLMLIVIVVGVAISTFVNFPTAAGALTSLLLAAGFLSIVVGLAAQSTLSNLVAGAMVSLSQPFKIGDAVVFPYPNGDWCFVEDIRLNFTVLRTWDLRRLMVPNALFQSSVLVNYTAVDPTMLVIVYLVITFESDVDRARAIMLEEARRHPDFLPLGNLPITHVMDYQGGGSAGSATYGVDLRLLSAARDQPTAFQVEKDLLYSIRRRFDAEGIRLAWPTQRVIYEPAGGPPPVRAGRARPSDA